MKTIAKILFLACLAISLGGCVAVGLTAAGVGMATGVNHTLSGMVYKTFTSPQNQVKRATMTALSRMQIHVAEAKREGATELIKARTPDRDIEIELEAITPNTTRMLVVAKKDHGILRDGATATEIILQTEKLVGPT